MLTERVVLPLAAATELLAGVTLKTGLAGDGAVMTNTALATKLSCDPVLNAFAFNVPDVVSVIGTVYAAEPAVGSLPFVVYLIVAPEVAQASVAVADPTKVPPFGVIVGVATVLETVPRNPESEALKGLSRDAARDFTQ